VVTERELVPHVSRFRILGRPEQVEHSGGAFEPDSERREIDAAGERPGMRGIADERVDVVDAHARMEREGRAEPRTRFGARDRIRLAERERTGHRLPESDRQLLHESSVRAYGVRATAVAGRIPRSRNA